MFWTKRKTIADKLTEIVADLPSLRKNGKGNGFDYLRIDELANAFHGACKNAGLVVIPNDLDCTINGNEATVLTEFQIEYGKLTKSVKSYGYAKSDGPWGALPIAQTMALKSWLKRLGMMFGEEDDAEYQADKSTLIDELIGHKPLNEKDSPEVVAQFVRDNEPTLTELGRPDLEAKIAEQENPDVLNYQYAYDPERDKGCLLVWVDDQCGHKFYTGNLKNLAPEASHVSLTQTFSHLSDSLGIERYAPNAHMSVAMQLLINQGRCVSPKDCRAFNSACIAHGKTLHMRRQWLHANFQVGMITNLPAEHFPSAMKWALNQEPLEKTLRDSITAVSDKPNGLAITEDEYDAGREPVTGPESL